MALVAQQSNPMGDKIRLAVAALVALAAIAGFYYLSGYPLVVRIGVLLVGVAIAAAIGWTSEPGKQFYGYTQDSIAETKKVVWPSRKETIQTTLIVVAFVIIMALFLWIVDATLVWLVKNLIQREG